MSPTTPAADGTMTRMALRRAPRGPDLDAGPAALDDLLHRVARGDAAAFELLYDRVAGSVFGVIRRVLRDPAQSEEVAQEVLVEVWRTATRFDAERGSASTWIHTMAHRRAIDRVRSAQASHDREERVAHRDHVPAYDEVVEHGRDQARAGTGPPLPAGPHRPAARVGHPGLLRRLHLPARWPSCSTCRSAPSRPGCGTG